MLKHDHIAEWRPLCGAVTYAFSTLLPLGGHSTIASHFIPPLACLTAQVYGSPRAFVSDDTGARDDGERKGATVAAPVPAAPAVAAPRATRGDVPRTGRVLAAHSLIFRL